MTKSSFSQQIAESGDQRLEVLYQDRDIVVINKPAGLLVHRSPIDRHETRFALQMLRNQLQARVYPAHRLDKPTSGVLLFGLSSEAARHLGEQFSRQEATKQYLAVVRGYCPDSGRIDHALREEDLPNNRVAQSQAAISDYQRLAKHELNVKIETYPQSRYSLVRLWPKTGRRHQLRRHMKHISHPIIGDAKHGRGRHNRYFAAELGCPRLLLHSETLTIRHPVSGDEMRFKAPLDTHFQGLINRFGWQAALSDQPGSPTTAI